jgi:hypothetical protein
LIEYRRRVPDAFGHVGSKVEHSDDRFRDHADEALRAGGVAKNQNGIVNRPFLPRVA